MILQEQGAPRTVQADGDGNEGEKGAQDQEQAHGQDPVDPMLD